VAKKVTGDALSEFNKALGLFGQSDSPETEFADGTLYQTIDAVPIVRRSRSLADSTGIFRGVMRNTHPGAGNIQSVVSPYFMEFPIPPFGDVVQGPLNPLFDLWLLGASCNRISGTGTMVAYLGIQNMRQGFGISDTGASIVVANEVMPLIHWDTVVGINQTFLTAESGQPYVRLNMRLPKQSQTAVRVQLFFRTTASAICVWDCQTIWGMFPAGLGQDVAV